jgi:hypothetical protein
MMGVYQEMMYYFFRNQLGFFWYILWGMAGLAHQAHDLAIQRTNQRGPTIDVVLS